MKYGFESFSFYEILFTALMIAIIGACWMQLVKPALQKNKELTDKNFSLLRLKNNPDVFKVLLRQQRKVDTTPFENDMQLGNTDAYVQIMVVDNPYCKACADAHKILDDLISKNNIGLTLRFGMKTQAASYILNLLNNKSKEYKKTVVYDWYKWMNLEKFKAKYLIKNENKIQRANEIDGLGDENEGSVQKDVDRSLDLFERWSRNSKIAFTPTIFINGYEMPKQYRVEDLKIILKEIEKINETNNDIIAENNYAQIG